jgi:ABC-type dipeptide/oligopeptide/nickel transport system ATPase component
MQADDIKVWYPIKRGFLRRTVDHIKAVDGLSLKLREGHTLGVVGESGSGKTTLGLALLRLVASRGPIAYVGKRMISAMTCAWALFGVERSLTRSPALNRFSEALNVAKRTTGLELALSGAAPAGAANASDKTSTAASSQCILLFMGLLYAPR